MVIDYHRLKALYQTIAGTKDIYEYFVEQRNQNFDGGWRILIARGK